MYYLKLPIGLIIQLSMHKFKITLPTIHTKITEKRWNPEATLHHCAASCAASQQALQPAVQRRNAGLRYPLWPFEDASREPWTNLVPQAASSA